MTAQIIKINNNAEIKVTRHVSGNLKSKVSYAHGAKHGLETYWYENGHKRWQVTCRNGKNHGGYIDWYDDDDDDQNRQVATWRDGRRHGLEIMRYENGQKCWEVYHLADKVYARIEWDEEGNITKTNFPRPSTITTRKTCKPQKTSKAKKITTTRS